MAWYPGAVRKEIRRHRTALSARKLLLHTAVSNGTSLYTYFNRSGNPTSHFYVRKDGTVEQYVDTKYRAPANLEGNSSCISIESWDGAGTGAWSGSNVPVWNAAQVNALIKLTRWVCQTHKIPFVVIPNSRYEHRGVGYHRQGVDPYRVSGGQRWSNAYGKVCPGIKRINQIAGIVKLAATGGTVEEEDMPLTAAEKQEIADLAATAVWFRSTGAKNDDGSPKLFWHAVRDNPENTATAVWYRASGLKTPEGADVPLWQVVRQIRSYVDDGAEVDEAAIAAAVASALLPTLSEIVAQAVENNVAGNPQEIAEIVVAEFSKALSTGTGTTPQGDA